MKYKLLQHRAGASFAAARLGGSTSSRCSGRWRGRSCGGCSSRPHPANLLPLLSVRVELVNLGNNVERGEAGQAANTATVT